MKRYFSFLALLLPLTANAQQAQPKAPISLKQALGCILTLPVKQENIRELGLRLGSTASVRFFVGNVPGLGPTPTVWYILIPSPDQTRAWILIADRRPDGKFTPMGFDADRLRRHGGRWEVEEGFGGFHTYAKMSRFANWLERTQPPYHVRLKPNPRFCAPD